MRALPLLCLVAVAAWGQAPPAPAKPKPAYSQHLMEVKQYTQAENETIIAKFKGLRTTDVFDGLQAAGIHKVTVMEREIGPMWTDNETFSHNIYGVAVTLRLVPPQETPPNTEFQSNAEMSQWQRTWSKRNMGADTRRSSARIPFWSSTRRSARTTASAARITRRAGRTGAWLAS